MGQYTAKLGADDYSEAIVDDVLALAKGQGLFAAAMHSAGPHPGECQFTVSRYSEAEKRVLQITEAV